MHGQQNVKGKVYVQFIYEHVVDYKHKYKLCVESNSCASNNKYGCMRLSLVTSQQNGNNENVNYYR